VCAWEWVCVWIYTRSAQRTVRLSLSLVGVGGACRSGLNPPTRAMRINQVKRMALCVAAQCVLYYTSGQCANARLCEGVSGTRVPLTGYDQRHCTVDLRGPTALLGRWLSTRLVLFNTRRGWANVPRWGEQRQRRWLAALLPLP
jgi:hypothetical protein